MNVIGLMQQIKEEMQTIINVLDIETEFVPLNDESQDYVNSGIISK